jgi:hypothetical protein
MPSIQYFHNHKNQVDQIRIHLDDDDPEVTNKTLIINKGVFNKPVFLSYEKHCIRNGKEVIEYYEDDVLISYYETIKVNKIHTVEGFGPDGTLFSREIKYFDNSNHYKSDIMIHNADGTTLYQTDYY